MNNSETKILYQSREGGRGDLCFEENYGSASFFFFFQVQDVNYSVCRSGEFWLLSKQKPQ